ncbi:hypothetical protein Vretifemale_16557 [Volvox reticuliferus]|uniref:Uncharacterized protein n=1 Tax=Volvox reticuliferus TaxID=1737510 RepID=A0A8J4FSM1_9CHLO|nr:hypothetical protein Vretifemale_16557 [Volvox reticuliferus]
MVTGVFVDKVDEAANAAVAWDELHDEFVKQMALQQQEYHTKVITMRKKHDESMDEYLRRAEEYHEILTATNFKIPDSVIVASVLNGLSSDYRTERAILEASASFGEATLKTIRPALLSAEVRVKREDKQETTPALVFGNRRGTGGGQQQYQSSQRQSYGHHPRQQKSQGDDNMSVCWKCGSTEHFKKNCPKWLAEQQSGQAGSGGNNRGGGNHRGGGYNRGGNRGAAGNRAGSNRGDSGTSGDGGRRNTFVLATTIDDVSQHIQSQGKWILDTGAGLHATDCKDDLIDYVEVENGPIFKAGFGGEGRSPGYGKVEFVTYTEWGTFSVTVTEVWYMPGLGHRILSAGRLDKKGCRILANNGRIFVQMENVSYGGYGTLHEWLDVMEGRLSEGNSGVYYMNIHTKAHQERVKALAVLEQSVDLWHRRFGHLGYEGLGRLAKEGMVKGLNVTADQVKEAAEAKRTCEPCVKAKLTRVPHPPSGNVSNLVLQRVHSDVCEMPIKSMGGARYMVTIPDEHSGFATVRLVATKDMVPDVLKEALTLMENQTGKRVREFQTDRGREYVNVRMREFFWDKGILHSTSVPYTPEQNGRAERLNRTLLEKVRAMLQDANLEQGFWAEAVMTACAIRNCSPVSDRGATPHELFHGYKPDVSVLRVFGCTAWVYSEKQHRNKLDPVCEKGVFVGYERGSKGYRVYLPQQRKVVVSCNVRFDEQYPQQDMTNIPMDTVSDDSDSDEEHSASDAGESGVIPGVGGGKSNGAGTTHDGGNIGNGTGSAGGDANIGQESRYPRRTHKAPDRYSPEPGKRHVTVAATTIPKEPSTYEEAINSPEAVHWRQAMDEEIASLHAQGTWRLEHPPQGANVIPGKWVYKLKRDANGGIERYKARYVAKGYKQIEGVDFDEVFAPTGCHATVRAFLASAAAEGMEVHHVDVRTAFLHGELEEQIYCEQPPGYVTGEGGEKCRLIKALYGLKQAGRAWHRKLEATLAANGFEISESDPSLFIKRVGSRVVRVLTHVDDLLIASNCASLMAEVKQYLAKSFDIRDLGAVSVFLGMEIMRNGGELKISQRRYAFDLVERFGLADAQPEAVPMKPNLVQLTAQGIGVVEQEPFEDATKYRALVGGLMYLAVVTRPDIAQAVYRLARYMSKPVPAHWEAAKAVLRYVKGTATYGIVYSRSEQLFGYADADWANDRDNRRSTTGYVFMMNGGAVSWKSRLQPTVAASSVEAEYMSASFATREAMWLRKLMGDFGYPVKTVHIWDDNQGAISLIRNPITSDRSKHIDVMHHFVREKEEHGLVSFGYCPTGEMVADVLTKPLPLAEFAKFRLSMGVR